MGRTVEAAAWSAESEALFARAAGRIADDTGFFEKGTTSAAA